jgi:hypothetical protein
MISPPCCRSVTGLVRQGAGSELRHYRPLPASCRRPRGAGRGRDWVRSLELSGPTEEVPDDGHPIHGSLVVDGRELARLLAAASDLPDGLSRCIVPGLAAALGLTDTIRIDVRYEQDALRVSGRIQYAEGPR